jgi:hypothetical protein
MRIAMPCDITTIDSTHTSGHPTSTSHISGLDNAGKTTILKKVTGGDISSVSPTLGFNIMSLLRGEYTLNVCAYCSWRTPPKATTESPSFCR